MKRRELLKLSGLLGLSLAGAVQLAGCGGSKNNTSTTDAGDSGDSGSDSGTDSLSVLIIGAGAAGMSAAHLLAQQGVSFRILEAAPTYGGRLKRTTDFADFPIPLGAEWLHVAESEFDRIINDGSVAVTTRTQGYSPQDRVGLFEDGELSISTLEDAFGDFADRKFVNSSWFDFFDTYIVPGIRAQMQFGTQVTLIDYQQDKVRVTDSNSQIYEADQVIVTVPVKVLQDSDITFVPALPANRLSILQQAPVWGGLKVFMRFSEKFYPGYLTFPDSETEAGQRLYYDAAYGQNSEQHILGLFALGEQAVPYQARSGNAQRDYILDELDTIFDGAASRSFVKHQVQDWSKEPFIRSAYLADVADSRISRQLAEPLAGKVYFAGDAYTREDDWGGVHNATRAARDVVSEMLS